MSKWQKEKEMVVETCRKMVARGLVVGSSGNVSLRLPPEDGRELIAVTPTAKDYDLLSADGIQVIDFGAGPVEGDLPPSVETGLHISVYRARKDVGAVIHTHSVYASVMAVAGLGVPPILEDQVTYIGGEIGVTKYAPSGSQEMVESTISVLAEKNAVLLRNHGMVGVGRSIREAFTICELAEKAARVYWCARLMGMANPLPPEAVEACRDLFARRLSSR